MLLRLASVAFLIAAPNISLAAQTVYTLETGESQVGFTVDFGPDRIRGTLPVRAADVALDFDNPPNSRVWVALDTTQARASFPFATQALRGPKVLFADQFPTLEFSTTDLRADAQRARVKGDLTIRGITRPIALDAQIFRQQGSASGDLTRLAVHLSGVVQRSEFDADGWSDLVGDEVRLDIRVRIRQAE